LPISSGGTNQISTKDVKTLVWLNYSIVLYNSCRQTDGEYHDQAWAELSAWLTRQASFLNAHNNDPEALAQETIAELFSRLPQLTINPQAFLGYALQCLKNSPLKAM